MLTELTDTIRSFNEDEASQRRAQTLLVRRLLTAARISATHGSIPSTANIIGWMTTALGIAASTTLGSAGSPDAGGLRHVPRGYTVIDSALTRRDGQRCALCSSSVDDPSQSNGNTPLSLSLLLIAAQIVAAPWGWTLRLRASVSV